MKRATLIISVLFALIFVGGMLYFPDAPIYEKDGAYIGKYGAVHSEATYERYRLWKMVVIAAFAATFISNLWWIASGKDANS